jgi:hypothetical protein
MPFHFISSHKYVSVASHNVNKVHAFSMGSKMINVTSFKFKVNEYLCKCIICIKPLIV